MDGIIAGNNDALEIPRKHGYIKPDSIQYKNGADERVWFPGDNSRIRMEKVKDRGNENTAVSSSL